MRNSGQLHQVAPPAPLHCPEPISINISDPGFGGSYDIITIQFWFWCYRCCLLLLAPLILQAHLISMINALHTVNPVLTHLIQINHFSDRKKALPMKHFIFEVILIFLNCFPNKVQNSFLSMDMWSLIFKVMDYSIGSV